MIKKNRMTRLLALSLASVMLLSLAACGSSKSETTTSSGSDTAASGTEAEAVSGEESTESSSGLTEGMLAAETSVTAEDILSRDFSKEITISFAGVQVTDGLDYNEGNEYYQYFHDLFNIEWDVTSLTFENWTERLNTWLNADDIPDWCVWNFMPGDAQNYVDQGLVKCLPDDWKEKYPNLAAAAEATPANAFYEELYGGTYFLFRPVFATNFPEEADCVTSHLSVCVRTDWAEQAGYDLSANIESDSITLDEFFAYCQAIKDAGITDYPFYGTSAKVGYLVDFTSEASGVVQSAYYLGEDGQYHWGPAEEESGVKEALRKVKEAYDGGLIYPEFYTMSNDDDHGYFYSSGDAAAVCVSGMAAYIDRFDSYLKSDLNTSYEDAAKFLILTDEDGVAHGDPSANYWACNIISPYIDDETLDRLLTIWDYSCTKEGQLAIRMGIEGTDWEYDEDGNLVNLLADTEYGDCNTKYTSIYPIYGNMFVLSDDFSFINPGFSEMAREECTELYVKRSQITSVRDEEPNWDLLSYSSQALTLASMTYADEYANIITKDGDFDENYDQWVADKMSLVQPVLDDMNATLVQ